MIATALLVLALAAPEAPPAPPAPAPAAAPAPATASGIAAQYAEKPGAVTTTSGLVYVPTRVGTGQAPTASSKVKVHYQGTLADGKIFDSSYKRGQPAEFPLGAVIPCWTEGVQKMRVGGEATLVCPSSIAYGERGIPGIIPPGATLIFKVELIDVR